jgi:hypothetical protein
MQGARYNLRHGYPSGIVGWLRVYQLFTPLLIKRLPRKAQLREPKILAPRHLNNHAEGAVIESTPWPVKGGPRVLADVFPASAPDVRDDGGVVVRREHEADGRACVNGGGGSRNAEMMCLAVD